MATVIIGKLVGEFDREKSVGVLRGDDPFDESTMIDDVEPPPLAEHPVYHPTHPAAETAAETTSSRSASV